MIKQLALSLALVMLLTGCVTRAQNVPQAFPPEVAAEIKRNWTV